MGGHLHKDLVFRLHKARCAIHFRKTPGRTDRFGSIIVSYLAIDCQNARIRIGTFIHQNAIDTRCQCHLKFNIKRHFIGIDAWKTVKPIHQDRLDWNGGEVVVLLIESNVALIKSIHFKEREHLSSPSRRDRLEVIGRCDI